MVASKRVRGPSVPKMGRPSKLTKALTDDVVKLVKAGNYPDTAAAVYGVARATTLDWLRKGAATRQRLQEGTKRRDLSHHERELVDFSVAVEAALATAESRHVALISQAATSNGGKAGDWRAAMELLARGHPDRWSRRDELRLGNGNGGGGHGHGSADDPGPSEFRVVIVNGAKATP